MSTVPLRTQANHHGYGATIPNLPVSLAEEGLTNCTADFLDGGLAAWLTVFGAFLALFCSFGQMNAFGTYQSWYTTHQMQELDPSTIAWIGSVQLWVFFFSVRASSDQYRTFPSAHQRPF